MSLLALRSREKARMLSWAGADVFSRKTTQEPEEDCAGDCEEQGRDEGQEEVVRSGLMVLVLVVRKDVAGGKALCVSTLRERDVVGMLWRMGFATRDALSPSPSNLAMYKGLPSDKNNLPGGVTIAKDSIVQYGKCQKGIDCF